jgi:hypothetical protein
MVDTSGGDQYGGRSATTVFDIRSGRSYVVASGCYEILSGFCPYPAPAEERILRAFVNRSGRAVVAFGSGGGSTVTISAFTSRGVRGRLDSGPAREVSASSLRLHGNTASWTHSGERRSQEI